MLQAKMSLREFLKNFSKYHNCLPRFRDYLNYSIDEFVKKKFNNKPYLLLQEECASFLDKLYNENNVKGGDNNQELKERISKPSDVFVTSPIAKVPYSLPLLELIFPKNIALIQNVISRIKQPMSKLIHLLDIDIVRCLATMPGVGDNKIKELYSLQDYIRDSNNWDSIVDAYDCCFKVHSFPECDYDTYCNMSLSEKFDLAINQYVEKMSCISNYYSKIKGDYERMRMFFIDKKTKAEVAQELELTEERARQLKIKYIKKLIDGNLKFAENLSLSGELLEDIKELSSQLPVYCAEKKMCELLGCEDYEESSISIFLTLKSTPEERESLGKNQQYIYFDQCYYMPSDHNKKNLQKYINSIYTLMSKDEIRPMSIDDIMIMLKEKESGFDFERDVVIDLLEQHTWFEQIDENEEQKYQLRYKYLNVVYAKIARIVYLYKSIKKEDLNEADQKLGGNGIIIEGNDENAKNKFTWCVQGPTGYLEYNESGENRQNLRVEVRAFVGRREVFNIQELKNDLRIKGFDVKENTIRAYASELCYISNDDDNIFCNSEHIERYRNYNWRNKAQKGKVNWAANAIRNILLKEPGNRMSVKGLTKVLKDKGEKDGYKIRSVDALISNLEVFDFVKEGTAKMLVLNEIGLSKSQDEWNEIGIRPKPQYYNAIVSKIMSLLKDAEDCEMRLVDLRDKCLPEMLGVSSTRFYKIVDNELPEQINKIKKDDGKIYLRLVQEKIEYIPTLQVEKEEDIQETTTTTIYTQPSRERAYGEIIQMDWELLAENLRKEISYNYWDLEIGIETAICRFIEFIRASKNRRVSAQIPRQLLVLWNYKSDIYDWKGIVNELTICYEEILRLIHEQNTGERLETKSLSDTYKQIKDIKLWYENSYTSSFYVNNMKKLQKDRNLIAHGLDLNYSAFDLIKKISNYTSLYIYMVAKFLKV